MKKITPEIKPKDGFGELKFGETINHVVEQLGEAEEIETIEDEDEFNTTILNYWEIGVSIFFEGVEKSVVSCFETDIPETTLFGKEVFELEEKELIALMTENGFEVAEIEEESGERRLSYDDALIDFFYQEGELLAVNWGVLVNDQGEIEEF